MKANSRRRVLISSMAMLLVALVALSTATFAWFTSNTTATANGINVKTVKTSTLEISDKNHDWDSTVKYNHTANMFPASTTTGTSFVKTVAADKKASDRDTTKDITSASGDSYVFANQLNVKNSGDGLVKNVKITIEKFTNKYGRIALLPANDAGTITYPEGKSFKDYVFDVDGETYDGLTDTEGNVVSINANNGMELTVGDLGKNEAKYFNLYIWFEGQDKDCYDANAGQTIYDTAEGNTTLQFTVSGTPDDTSITG